MRKLLFRLILIAVILGPILFILAAFEPEPDLPQSAALSPRQAAESKALVKRLRAAAGGTQAGARAGAPAEITATRGEIDGLIAAAARIAPSLRGGARMANDSVILAASAELPGLPEAGWINLRAEISADAEGLNLRALRLGRMDLPPALTLGALRLAADLYTADDLGTLLVSSVRGMRTEGDRVTLRLAGEGEGGSLFGRVMSGLRDAAGLSDGASVQAHYEAMTQAALDGRLPARGPLGPWLAFAVERAAAAPEDRAAALLALAAHCGDRRAVETAVGGFDAPRADSPCAGATLAGREDLRKHFALSAGFQAAGGSAVSFGLGEVKELVDGAGGGSGFSFDDVAADKAGIRWAEAVAATEASALPRLAELSARTENVMPSIHGLPSFMQAAEFEARFGGTDSPAYKREMEKIEARIDALPLHR